MKEYFQRKDTQISIGEMAELFEVSPRTLRLYHDMGLLIPQYINDSNGYRYYAQSQFPRLEKVLQMKSLGLSLQQIKTMLEQKNLSLFEALLNERIDRLNEKIAQDTASRDILIKQLNSCAKLRNPPVLDSAFIEFIPKRYALDFQIDAYDLKEDYSNGSPWEQALGQIRGTLLNHHLSPSLLYQACCTITKQNLIEGRYVCNGALLLTDAPIQTVLPQKIVQSGTYACLYRNYCALDGQSESVGLDQLLLFIRDNHYQITGDYLGEVLAKTSIYDYSDSTILVKFQIPIKFPAQEKTVDD